MRLASILLLCIPISVLAQDNGTPTPASVREQWVSAWNAKQLDKVMSLYDANSVLLAASGDVITGRDNIRSNFKQRMDSGDTGTATVNSQHSDSSGDLAYESGEFDEAIAAGGRHNRGSYLVVLKRESGNWLIVQQALVRKPDSGRPNPPNPPTGVVVR